MTGSASRTTSGSLWAGRSPCAKGFAKQSDIVARDRDRPAGADAPINDQVVPGYQARGIRLLLPENERLEGRIGKARRSWAFSARLHMSAENVNAWWWMQPDRTGLIRSNSQIPGKILGISLVLAL